MEIIKNEKPKATTIAAISQNESVLIIVSIYYLNLLYILMIYLALLAKLSIVLIMLLISS